MRTPLLGYFANTPADLAANIPMFQDLCARADQDFRQATQTERLIVLSEQAKNGFFFCGKVAELEDGAASDRLIEFAKRVSTGNLISAEIPFGTFAIAHLDGNALSLITDAFGSILIHLLIEKTGAWFTTYPALFAHMDSRLTLRKSSVQEGFHRLWPVPPLGNFEETRFLAASSCARLTPDTPQPQITTYHRFSTRIDPVLYSKNKTAAKHDKVARMGTLLEAAVRKSLAGYNSAGILLSGGVDSSTLSAYAVNYCDLKAVHVDQPGGYSELSHAQDVARAIGVDLHVVNLNRDSYRRNFVDAVYEMGTPFFYSNTVGLLQAMREGAFNGVDVVLDGEMADGPMWSSAVPRSEVMRYFYANRWRLPQPMVNTLFERTPALLKKLGFNVDGGVRPGGLHEVIGMRMAEEIACREEIQGKLDHISALSEKALAEQTFYALQRGSFNIISRLDAALRTAGKHALLPFSDTDYLDFVLNLPAEDKVGFGGRLRHKPEMKFLLKELAVTLLPRSAVYRPKVGFGVDDTSWLGGFPEELKRDSWVQENYALGTAAFESLCAGRVGKPDLYLFVALEVWGRIFIRREDRTTLKARFLGEV